MSTSTLGSAAAAFTLAGLAVLGTAGAAAAQTAECYPSCPRSISDSTPVPGQTVTVTTAAGSFAAGEAVEYGVESTYQRLGTTTADATGAAGATFRIPTDLDAGRHDVVFTGTSGTVVRVGFRVVSAADDGRDDRDRDGDGVGGALPFTGSGDIVAISSTGAALVVAGVGLVVVARRRRADTPV